MLQNFTFSMVYLALPVLIDSAWSGANLIRDIHLVEWRNVGLIWSFRNSRDHRGYEKRPTLCIVFAEGQAFPCHRSVRLSWIFGAWAVIRSVSSEMKCLRHFKLSSAGNLSVITDHRRGHSYIYPHMSPYLMTHPPSPVA